MVRARAWLSESAIKDVEISVTLTMTVGEWKKVREQLKQEWPSWQLASTLGSVLNSLVDRVETAHEATS